jgi:DNA-directed RNA polymerase specialized sigma24 family protein
MIMPQFPAQPLCSIDVAAESAVKNKVNSDQDAVSEVFCAHLERLHLQAYILTGSPSVANECVVEAFEVLQGSFLAAPEFAYDAARLATIKSALRRVAPDIRHFALHDSAGRNEAPNHYSSLGAFSLEKVCRERFLTSILQLNVLHRAVLLLRMYEHYRAYVASVLLRLPVNVIERGKIRAIELLVGSIHAADTRDAGKGFFSELMTLQVTVRPGQAQTTRIVSPKSFGSQ